MWSQIVAVLAILIGISYVIEKIFFRNRKSRRRVQFGRELIPLIVLTGILLTVLSFIEAYRRESIEPWLWGLAFGTVLSLLALASGLIQGATARGAFTVVRVYGVAAIVVLIGIYIAVRLIGASAQVFAEGTLSVGMFGAAVVLAARTRDRAVPDKP